MVNGNHHVEWLRAAGSISEGFKIKASLRNIKVNGILFVLREGLKDDAVKLTQKNQPLHLLYTIVIYHEKTRYIRKTVISNEGIRV